MATTKRAAAQAKGSGKCPVAFALDLVGDRWSLLILRDVFFKQKQRYGEFLASAEGISTNILANRLARLEAAGILSKQPDPEQPSRSVYRVTDKGADLLPLLLDMIEWSARYDPQPGGELHIVVGAPADLLARSRTDRPALVAELRAAIGASAPRARSRRT